MHNKDSSVLRAVAKVAGGTAVSRVAGLVREILMARLFGTSGELSAFVVAFRIPNLFRKLFGEGALSAAFIPAYAEAVARGGAAEGERLLGRIVGFVVSMVGVLVALCIILTYPLEAWLAASPRFAAIFPLLRIMLPYAPLICVAALAMGALNVLRVYWLPALTPALLNVIWIVALLAVCPYISTELGVRIGVVAWAILLAGVVQMVFQVVALRRMGVRLRCDVRWWRDSAVLRVLRRAMPLALASGVIQVNVCIDGLLAMWAGSWAPAALEYADRLVHLPLGLIGTAFATVLLPTFANQAAQADTAAIAPTLERALRNLIVLMTPAAVGLFVLALPLSQLFYQYKGGQFDALSSTYCARALMGYAPGLLIFCFHKAVTPAFYALGDVTTPVRVSLLAVVLNFAMNLTFVLTLPDGWQHAGIAVATVLSSFISVAILTLLLRRKGCAIKMGALGKTAFWALLAASGMGVVAAMAVKYLAAWPEQYGKIGEIGRMAFTLAAAVAFYGTATWFSNRAALAEVLPTLRKRATDKKRMGDLCE